MRIVLDKSVLSDRENNAATSENTTIDDFDFVSIKFTGYDPIGVNCKTEIQNLSNDFPRRIVGTSNSNSISNPFLNPTNNLNFPIEISEVCNEFGIEVSFLKSETSNRYSPKT